MQLNFFFLNKNYFYVYRLKNRKISTHHAFFFFYRETPLDFIQNCLATTNKDPILDSSPPSLFCDDQKRFVYSKHC